MCNHPLFRKANKSKYITPTEKRRIIAQGPRDGKKRRSQTPIMDYLLKEVYCATSQERAKEAYRLIHPKLSLSSKRAATEKQTATEELHEYCDLREGFIAKASQ